MNFFKNLLHRFNFAIAQNKNSQTYLENIIERIPYYIFWKNVDSVYLGCNKNFSNLVGKKPYEVVGKTDFDLPWGEGDAEFYRLGDRKVTSDSLPISTEEKITINNIESTMLVSKVPLLDDSGKCIGVLGISNDISERKKMEEQLKIAKQKAEVANHAKTQFIANMSHDVKTPLAGIIGMAELLTHQLHEKEHIDFVLNIQLAGQQLMNFFDNCLDMAKLQEADVVLTEERFCLKLLLEEVKQLFWPSIEHKGLSFDIYYDNQLPDYLMGSRVGVYRILLNIIGNAVKFTETGFVAVHAELVADPTAEKIIVKLTIKDSGIGIPKDKQKIIFDRFIRLIPSYKKTYEGSGIGLYLVKKFVTSMQGEIYVRSDGEGKGSEFVVTLPFAISNEKESQKNLSLDDVSGLTEKIKKYVVAPSDNSENIKVLLVEDDKLSQLVASEYLKTAGYHVDLADSGEKAIELFVAGKYNFVFMDIGLPGISGYEATKIIRVKEKNSGLADELKAKIIALTAHVAPDIQQECDLSYIDGIVNKPLSLEKIYQFASSK